MGQWEDPWDALDYLCVAAVIVWAAAAAVWLVYGLIRLDLL